MFPFAGPVLPILGFTCRLVYSLRPVIAAVAFGSAVWGGIRQLYPGGGGSKYCGRRAGRCIGLVFCLICCTLDTIFSTFLRYMAHHKPQYKRGTPSNSKDTMLVYAMQEKKYFFWRPRRAALSLLYRRAQGFPTGMQYDKSGLDARPRYYFTASVRYRRTRSSTADIPNFIVLPKQPSGTPPSLAGDKSAWRQDISNSHISGSFK